MLSFFKKKTPKTFMLSVRKDQLLYLISTYMYVNTLECKLEKKDSYLFYPLYQYAYHRDDPKQEKRFDVLMKIPLHHDFDFSNLERTLYSCEALKEKARIDIDNSTYVFATEPLFKNGYIIEHQVPLGEGYYLHQFKFEGGVMPFSAFINKAKMNGHRKTIFESMKIRLEKNMKKNDL